MKKIFLGLFGIFVASNVYATVIDFDTLGVTSGYYTDTFTEDGYDLVMTDMYIDNDSSSTAHFELESHIGEPLGSSYLTIEAPGLFTFNTIDYETEFGSSSTLYVEGFLGGVSQGMDSFTSMNGAGYETFAASVLAGLSLDALKIYADRGNSRYGAFDTVVLSAVPLPAAAYMFIPALIGLFGLSRNHKTA
jgi:hypothetical protein